MEQERFFLSLATVNDLFNVGVCFKYVYVYVCVYIWYI